MHALVYRLALIKLHGHSNRNVQERGKTNVLFTFTLEANNNFKGDESSQHQTYTRISCPLFITHFSMKQHVAKSNEILCLLLYNYDQIIRHYFYQSS